MILNSSRKLQIVLAGAITANQLPVIVDYEDDDGTSRYSDSFVSATNSTTAVDIALSPIGSYKRTIKSIQVYNRDTAAATVQISVVTGATSSQLTDVILQVDDVLTYTDAGAWKVADANGNTKSTSTIAGLLSTSPSTGVGYATGAGAAVTQITNRSTGVTINAVCGTIQTDTTSLAAGASAEFTVTNSAVAIGDVVVVSQQSGSDLVAGVAGTTIVEVVTVAAGSFILSVNNNSSTTAETGAIIINFAVVKSVSA